MHMRSSDISLHAPPAIQHHQQTARETRAYRGHSCTMSSGMEHKLSQVWQRKNGNSLAALQSLQPSGVLPLYDLK